jgi:hypothetical protein
MALLMCGPWGNNLMHGVQFAKGFIFFCGSINAWGFDLLQFFWCMGFNFQVVSFGVGFVDARGSNS